MAVKPESHPSPPPGMEDCEIVNIVCRNPRGSCDSTTSYKVIQKGLPNPQFRCTRCGHSQSLNLGGNFQL